MADGSTKSSSRLGIFTQPGGWYALPSLGGLWAELILTLQANMLPPVPKAAVQNQSGLPVRAVAGLRGLQPRTLE